MFEDVPAIQVRHHFYNPRTGRPAHSCGDEYGYTSPDWALEDRGQIDGIGPTRHQDNSFADTRQFFLDALTKPTKDERDSAWGRTFQGLGQVLHHLADMAQPQHVRNDMHLSVLNPPGDPCTGDESWYEKYTELFGRFSSSYEGYAPVYSAEDTQTFNTARRFWDSDGGKGIAEYTNRGFVSAGTNFDQVNIEEHPQPEIALEWEEDKTEVCNQLPRPLPSPVPYPCVMTFISTYVEDLYRPDASAMNKRASTLSVFSYDLKRLHDKQVYTLNKFNFHDTYEFLIPRAVGYSAGLINYFFRGKINVVPNDQVAGQDLIKNEGTELLKGTFFLYYDATDGKRHPVLRDAAGEAAGWTTPPDGLAAGATMPLPVFLPPTDATTPDEYLLVFHGTMGEEPANAVAGRVVQTSPCPTDYLLPPYGITEWWGPGCVRLAWHGPFARYSIMRHTGELSDQIFSNGRAVATAPGPVIGVALQRDAQSGQQFLLAVVAGMESSGGVQLPDAPDRTGWITSEKLYARGLQSPAEWALVRQFGMDPDNGTAYPAHYYFNESGTKAVNGGSTFLSVTAASGEADHYEDPGPTHEPINHSTNTGGCDSTSLSCSSSSTSDSSSEYEMQTDYRGDHLVRLYWHGQDHYESSGTRSRDSTSFAGSSGGETAWTSSQWLTTTTGWEWNLIQEAGSSSGSNEWTDFHERVTLDEGQSHSTSLTRRVDYLDLRFNPPLMVYVERQHTYDYAYRAGHDASYVWHVDLDSTTETTQEQFAWLIHGGEYDMEHFYNLPRNHPGHFAGGNVSEIIVGGTSAHPQIQAEHHYLDFVGGDGNSYEGFHRNFQYSGGSGDQGAGE